MPLDANLLTPGMPRAGTQVHHWASERHQRVTRHAGGLCDPDTATLRGLFGGQMGQNGDLCHSTLTFSHQECPELVTMHATAHLSGTSASVATRGDYRRPPCAEGNDCFASREAKTATFGIVPIPHQLGTTGNAQNATQAVPAPPTMDSRHKAPYESL